MAHGASKDCDELAGRSPSLSLLLLLLLVDPTDKTCAFDSSSRFLESEVEILPPVEAASLPALAWRADGAAC